MKRFTAFLLAAVMVLSTCFIFGDTSTLEASAENEYSDLKAEDLINMDELYGWAAVPANGIDTTSGGGNTQPIIVEDFGTLYALAQGNEPRVIVISGTIETRGEYIWVGSNKTIVGIDENATIHGEIVVENQSNVIISNLNIQGFWPATHPEDGIRVQGSDHVWMNHLNIWDAPDGNLDIVGGADYCTVSWCKFWYTNAAHEHRISNLIGSGTGNDDTDLGKLNVTYHHNWFADLVNQRMPKIAYGKVHVYNDYYTCTGNSYCIGVGCYASALIQNNYFEKVRTPHYFMYTGAYPTTIVAEGNKYIETSGSIVSGQSPSNTGATVLPFDNPPYEYYLDDAEDVPEIVSKGAGPQNILSEEKSKRPDDLITPAPAATAEPKELPTSSPYPSDNPISYDEESDTYTYHGQNADGSNGSLTVPNPFKGLDLSETPTYDSKGYPKYKKGVTLSYWVYVPQNQTDAPVFNFNLIDSRQMNIDDLMAYKRCQDYDPSNRAYSLGEVSYYYSLSGKKLTVLKNNGTYALYSPEYPEEGAYKISNNGNIPAYPEGADPEDVYSYVYLTYMGESKYSTHSKKFDEEGGENSLLGEALTNGSLSLFASGSIGYSRDNGTAVGCNPNLDTYGNSVVIDGGSQFVYWGNGGNYRRNGGLITPTMAAKGEWHFVVSVIQNDWIQTYMDGIKLTNDYLTYYRYSLSSSNYFDTNNAHGYAFNRGFGPRGAYRTSSPGSIYAFNKTILDMITDEEAVLSIGGTGCASRKLDQINIRTGADVQVKNIKAYPIAIPDSYIGKDYVLSYVNGYAIQGDKLVEIPADDVPEPTASPTPEPTASPTPKPTASPTPEPSNTPEASDTPEPSNTPSGIPGDIDGNGFVDAEDALAVLKYAAQLITDFTEEQIALADIDHNNTVDAEDALLILKTAAQLEL